MLKLVRQWPTVISIAANIYSRVDEIRANKVLRCKICSFINLIQVTAEICVIVLDFGSETYFRSNTNCTGQHQKC